MPWKVFSKMSSKTLHPPSKLIAQDYARFHDLIQETSGIIIPESRRGDMEKVIFQLMADLSIEQPADLYKHITEDAQGERAREDLIAQITVGETYFYRNRSQFDVLEKTILPEIIEKRREIKQIRIWSAGCSSGEEPYSLAILLKKLIPDQKDWRIHILATDINHTALKQAQQGVFKASSFRLETPNGFKEAYFDRVGDVFYLKPVYREMVSFSYLNLIESNYPSILTNTQMMDLILCRNVFIYFNESNIHKMVDRFHECLSQGGWLIVGHAEPSLSIFNQFSVHNFPGAIIYRKPPPLIDLVDGCKEKTPLVIKNQILQNKTRENVNKLPKNFIHTKKDQISPNITPQPPIQSPKNNPLHSPHFDIQSAISLYNAGLIDDALNSFGELAATNPGNGLVLYWMAKVYAGRLDYGNAEHWIGEALKHQPLLAPAHYLKGLIYQEQGKLEQSLAALRNCLYADPNFFLGYYNLAGIHKLLLKPHKAMKILLLLEEMLSKFDQDDLVPEGDGITIGQLSKLVSGQKELISV